MSYRTSITGFCLFLPLYYLFLIFLFTILHKKILHTGYSPPSPLLQLEESFVSETGCFLSPSLAPSHELPVFVSEVLELECAQNPVEKIILTNIGLNPHEDIVSVHCFMESHGEEHSNQHWPEFPQGYRPCALIQFSAASGCVSIHRIIIQEVLQFDFAFCSPLVHCDLGLISTSVLLGGGRDFDKWARQKIHQDSNLGSVKTPIRFLFG